MTLGSWMGRRQGVNFWRHVQTRSVESVLWHDQGSVYDGRRFCWQQGRQKPWVLWKISKTVRASFMFVSNKVEHSWEQMHWLAKIYSVYFKVLERQPITSRRDQLNICRVKVQEDWWRMKTQSSEGKNPHFSLDVWATTTGQCPRSTNNS